MTDQEKKDFTVRIAAANSMGLIAIDYEIFDKYAEDAEKAFEDFDAKGLKDAIAHCEKVINHLIDLLDFNQGLSKQLYVLYRYSLEQLAKVSYTNNLEGLNEARKVMNELGQSFKTLAKADSSKPIMTNAQQITAGITYGRNCVGEMVSDTANRGFWA